MLATERGWSDSVSNLSAKLQRGSLVSNPKFAAMMQEKINMKVDTAAIDQEIANYEKQLRQSYSIKSKLMEEIDTLDPDDRHYIKRKADLDDRLYKMYDRIEEVEPQLVTARVKKQAIEAEKLTGDNIYKVLIYFEKLYAVMNEAVSIQFDVRVDSRLDNQGVKRLCNIIDCTQYQPTLLIAHVGKTCDQNDRDTLGNDFLLQFFQQRKSVHPRHDNI